uniref:Uncharacterized protein n=1 Tax=Setaria viridis TaxID=4556 RepID=A0A4U6VGR9_SETVI|nr:hypothetical protein SEVIR_3G285950v2 [Setaria viridis]
MSSSFLHGEKIEECRLQNRIEVQYDSSNREHQVLVLVAFDSKLFLCGPSCGFCGSGECVPDVEVCAAARDQREGAGDGDPIHVANCG